MLLAPDSIRNLDSAKDCPCSIDSSCFCFSTRRALLRNPGQIFLRCCDLILQVHELVPPLVYLAESILDLDARGSGLFSQIGALDEEILVIRDVAVLGALRRCPFRFVLDLAHDMRLFVR